MEASYLSPRVYNILCKVPRDCDDNLTKIKTYCSCIFPVKGSSVCLQVDDNESDRKQIFLCNARHIWRLAKRRNLNSEDLFHKGKLSTLISLLDWTDHLPVFTECMLESADLMNLSMLKLTAVMERALGDVFITMTNSKKCPSLLSDLLKTDELLKVFGGSLVAILQTLMGPPVSLNLRNILWHGFPMLGEVPIEYYFTLIEQSAALGQALKRNGFPSLKHRPKLKIPGVNLISNIFPIMNIEKDLLFKLFKSTAFIPLGMLPAWKMALELFFSGRYGDAVVLFLPQLEHALRCLFTVVNQCPGRLTTAESDVLYTTFDEILAKEIEPNKPNKLLPEIGTKLTEMLYDLLYFPEGLRLRDRVSHGEYDFRDLDIVISNYVICIGICFCLKYIFPWRLNMTKKYKFLADVEKTMEDYRSVFHPISFLSREVNSAVKNIEILQNAIDEMTSDQNADVKKDSISEIKKISTFYLTFSSSLIDLEANVKTEADDALLKESIRKINEMPREVLHRSKIEIEINGILRNVTRQCCMAADQLLLSVNGKKLQLEKRSLRSRARANFITMVSVLPVLTSFWLTLMLVVSVESLVLATTKSEDLGRYLVKYLKKCLKYAENITSFCSSTKNKWLECLKITSQFTEIAERRMAMTRQE